MLCSTFSVHFIFWEDILTENTVFVFDTELSQIADPSKKFSA